VLEAVAVDRLVIMKVSLGHAGVFLVVSSLRGAQSRRLGKA
jgi:hypothetical protein